MGQPGTMVENSENIGETIGNMVERLEHIRGVKPENSTKHDRLSIPWRKSLVLAHPGVSDVS